MQDWNVLAQIILAIFNSGFWWSAVSPDLTLLTEVLQK